MVQEQACSNNLGRLARLWCWYNVFRVKISLEEVPLNQHYRLFQPFKGISLSINHILCNDVSVAEVGTRIFGQFVELFEESAPRMKGAQPNETGASFGPATASKLLRLILGGF